MKDYGDHIYSALLNVIEKINRTVNQTDRDGGFIPLADALERTAQKFITRLLCQLKAVCNKISERSIAKIGSELATFKDRVETKLDEDWLMLRFYAFNRALKGRGIVPKGATQAKDFENGRNWNQELTDIIAPGINKWYNTHREHMEPMEASLRFAVAQLHSQIRKTIENSTANLVIIDKAKIKWSNYGEKMEAMMMVLMTEVAKVKKRELDLATMKFGRDDNLVSSITDGLYDDVLDAAPDLKPSVPGAKKQKKQYTKPGRFQFQKNRMRSHFVGAKEDFVDKTFRTFQTRFDKNIEKLVDEHFAGIVGVLADFTTHLRGQAPLDYIMTKDGLSVRAELEQQISELERQAKHLRSLVPQRVKAEDETSPSVVTDTVDHGASFEAIYERLTKLRKSEQATKRGVKRSDNSLA